MSLSPFIHHDHSPSPTHDFNANRPANFLAKLYHALNEDANAKQAMYWSPDGFQLIVADPKLLETHVLPYHYKHCKFTSFCRQLNIYGFARVYPGRHFEDANGASLANASVWAHPTLHQNSTMDELMAVKRRAPPRLFRNRKGLAHHQDDRIHRAQGSLWNTYHPYGDTAFLPVLDFDCPVKRFERRRDLPGRAISPVCRDPDQVTMGDKEFERRRTNMDRNEYSRGLFEGSISNAPSHETQTGQGVSSPDGLSEHVPSPQQIIQAMARSRIATHSTPTTPRMSPWKHSSWNDVAEAADEPLGSSTQHDRPTVPQVQPRITPNFSFPAIRSAQSKARMRPSARDTTSKSHELGLTYSRDPHYVIEPDMGTLQPLNVPLYGDKPLPAPSHWSEQAAFIPSCLPYVVSVPPAGSNYAAFMEKQSPFTTKDIIGSFGVEALQSSYLGADHEIC